MAESGDTISGSDAYRSSDELRNLYYAVTDAVWRCKGWGELDPEADQADERFAEAKPIVEDVLRVWGLKAEEAQLDQAEAEAAEKAMVTNGYGALTKRPFVNVHAVGQFRPEMARQVALWLLDVAAVAEDDAVLLRWVEGKLDASPEASAQMMVDLREYREQMRRDDHADEGEQMPELHQLRTRHPRRIDR